MSLVLAVALFEERIRMGWWLLPEVVGVGFIVWGVVMLSRAVPAVHGATDHGGMTADRHPE